MKLSNKLCFAGAFFVSGFSVADGSCHADAKLIVCGLLVGLAGVIMLVIESDWKLFKTEKCEVIDQNVEEKIALEPSRDIWMYDDVRGCQ